jgi:hypothetical protein
MNISETIKQIQTHIKFLENPDFTTLLNSDNDLKLSIETRMDKLIAKLPDKMPYPNNENFFGYKNGDMYSKHTNKMTSANPEKNGYIRNGVGKNGVDKKNIYRHRFIYTCYHNITLKFEDQIDHINGNKEDNSIWNLQLLNAKEHAIKTLSGKKSKGGITQSKPIIRFKLDENDEQYDITEYRNVASAVEDMKCTEANIRKSLFSKTKMLHKYYWEYAKIIEDEKFKNEVWKKLYDIDDKFKDTKHEISDFGRIKSFHGIISYGSLHPSGYMRVGVNEKNYAVHTLVCLAFCGKQPSKKHSVDHINKITDDNRKENLRWATSEDQSDNNNSKPINVFKDDKLVGKYKSMAFASRELNLYVNCIHACIKGMQKGPHKGYTFELA